ncbi:hypothetical protein [Methanimicrococcus blatticola]|uniref:hypothetical protein n=1 Tax=Methanimicrococcus blatticola TaxID=91560 RepID=UPI001060D228|nr:hypothetical protein [Methanimicrococcus blatticola]MBZ3935917.1 hypothetical protein [Methanimicrococcus blatticola]MCC2509470.1 hypothetical protein [Methanimicrococcus blatticola]
MEICGFVLNRYSKNEKLFYNLFTSFTCFATFICFAALFFFLSQPFASRTWALLPAVHIVLLPAVCIVLLPAV